MSNKSILFLILIVPAILISGCIFNNPTPVNPQSQVIPQTNLPSGFTFMGIHEVTVEIGGSSMNATEGVYRNNKEDIYIQVIKNNQPSFLITLYKQAFNNAKYDPFEEVSFNGHNATKVKDYSTANGKQLTTYTVIWSTNDSVIIVGPSTDSNSLLNLATATGH